MAVECDGFARICDGRFVREYTGEKKLVRRRMALCAACAAVAQASGIRLELDSTATAPAAP